MRLFFPGTRLTGIIIAFLTLLTVVLPAHSFAQQTLPDGTSIQTDEPSVDSRPRGVAPVNEDPGQTAAGGPLRQDGSDIYGEIGYWILSLFAYLTGVAGIFLNAVVYFTVVKMAYFVDSMPAIVVAWRVLRDIGNIALIFGFIAIGLATILDIQSYNAKRMLVKLIIVAVTVNFSLFAARAIIDVGNVFAYQFYAQLMPEGTEFSGSPADEGVSIAIMNMVGLTKFYDPYAIEQSKDKIQTLQQNSVFAFVLASMLFLVAAFVMFALAIMLVSRFVILVFLMIVAPLGFVGLIVPTLEKRARDWWSMLIAQSATAPVLLLMLLISVVLISTATGGPTARTGNFDAFFGGNSSGGWLASMNLILGFFISMGFLMASLIVAKQAGAFGANFAISTSRRAMNFALAPVARPARSAGNWAARKTLNTVGNAYEGTGAGRLVRSIPLIGKLADEGFAQGANRIKNTKVDGKSYATRQEEIKHREHEVSVEDSIASLRGAAKANDDKKVGQLLQKMGAKDVANAFDRMSKGERASLARSMSVDAYTAIMKDDKVDAGVKHDLAHDRYAKLAAAPAANDKAEVRRWSGKDVAEYAKADPQGFDRLVNTVDLLSDDQREYLEKSDALTNLQKQAVKDTGEIGAVKRAFNDLQEELAKPAQNQNAVTIAALKLRIKNETAAIRSAKSKVKVGRKILLSQEAMPSVDVATFQAMVEGKELDAQDIDHHTNFLLTLPQNDPLRLSFRNYYANNQFSRALSQNHAQI